MNAIPYFDYSMAPFWPSYQNKIVGVLNRALREQSGSRIRRILLRLPWEHDNAFSDRKIWFGMDFIETVSALMNATPGRDRKSTRLNSSHANESRMPSSA